MGLFKKDSGGQIFSLDLLLALIPIVLIMGMAAADMDNILYLTQNAVFQSSTERAAFDTVNTLIETSGDNVTWELTGNPRVPGLAKYDTIKKVPVEGTVDATKLGALSETQVQNMLGNNYGFFINVTRVGSSYSVKTLGTYNSSAKNIVKVERFVLYGYLDVVSSAKDLIRYTQASNSERTYTQPPDPFPTNLNYVNTFDYWVIVNNTGYHSATVSINNNRVVVPTQFHGGQEIIKSKVDPEFLENQTNFQDNEVTINVRSNPWSSMDVYVVKVPKNTPESEISLDNVKPKRYKFQFYLWVK